MLRKNPDSPIRGVLLDAVGTSITPRPSVAHAYAEAAARQGVTLDPDLVRSRFARAFAEDEFDEHRGPLSTSEPTEYRRWRRIVAGVLGEVPDPDRAFEELWGHFARPEAWEVFEDVTPFLRGLEAAGLRVCMASNFDVRLRGVLAGLPALSGLVDSIVISSEVGYRKPHPEFFRIACSRLGLPPGSVLSVGDDPENDVRGAREAGLAAVLLDRRDRNPEVETRFATLTEIVERLTATEPGTAGEVRRTRSGKQETGFP